MDDLIRLLNEHDLQWRDRISPDPLEAALYLGLIDDAYLDALDVPELDFNKVQDYD